ncbi:mechanosensitive ion channel protein MscS [Oleiphilus sp. HI0009]|uniref:mechanosensitive ion channel family protein n=1 Tax=Oleiphilus sp. HI0125 TaxID=1822266 RepID=UPI0007C26CBA|nr:mechanosensitive ion channel domain-containing protein [Oleiphilus sp. HI0125]KZX74844.1 mechanosensitive ion channel protein MscS [Oleiphilus sp. HI0009]KZZ57298.1 mechanosensitive ion channel protein MscS [Oleiphilus sp. HI0125]MCH2158184.1 mechanosensitive ion channel [Oleiphilaceae bacterium]
MSLESVTEEKVYQISDQMVELAIAYGPKVLIAIFSLVVGFWVIGRIVNVAEKHLISRTEQTLASFLKSLLSIFLKAILIIMVAAYAGVETTSLVAVLGAAGLAVGFALQGSLSNFAGGVLILFFKPFKVGDLIEAQGFIGTVKEIQIFNTILLSPDNRMIVIPNGKLSNDSLININHEPTRRVDFVFGVAYADDIDKVKAIIERVVSADERVLSDPEKTIVLGELADSSVNFTVRLWAKTSDYWGVYFDTHEAIKKAFDAEQISIPFPQQDVYLHQASND